MKTWYDCRKPKEILKKGTKKKDKEGGKQVSGIIHNTYRMLEIRTRVDDIHRYILPGALVKKVSLAGARPLKGESLSRIIDFVLGLRKPRHLGNVVVQGKLRALVLALDVLGLISPGRLGRGVPAVFGAPRVYRYGLNARASCQLESSSSSDYSISNGGLVIGKPSHAQSF